MQIYNKRYTYTQYNDKTWNAIIHSHLVELTDSYSGLRNRFKCGLDQSVSMLKLTKNSIVPIYTINIPLNEIKLCRIRGRGLLISSFNLTFRKFNFDEFRYGIVKNFISIKKFTNFPLGYDNKINRMTEDFYDD